MEIGCLAIKRVKILALMIVLSVGCHSATPPAGGLAVETFHTSISTTSPTTQVAITSAATPTLPVTDQELSASTATATPETPVVWIDPAVPETLREAITALPGIILTESGDQAYLRFSISDNLPLSHWIYVLVTPFPTLVNGVTSQDLRSIWRKDGEGILAGSPLLLDESTLAAFSTWWGAPEEGATLTLPAEELLDYAWEHRPSFAIIPFEALEPRWKVIQVDGLSPIHKEFDPQKYSLRIPFGVLSMDGSVLPNPPTRWQLPATNRDPSRLTTLAMTGVTAMVRGTAWMMDHYGITYPAQDIASLLRSADLTHISNEIPFSASCPTPEIYPTELIFCSDPSYIALLEEIGTDFIELTGDHFGDYGIEATLYTLDIYRERGWPYYGGGVNADEARQPLLIEHNGNRLAFLGCNIGCQVKTEVPCTALATAERPGAAQCDFEWLEDEIPRLRSDGYQVIVTFQHKEYYTYTAQPNLVADFGRVAQAGAILVSGSQAHQAHGLAFEYGALIHYGLGNLFFDQVNFCADYACNYAFIDRHVFYQNRLVSTELIPLRFLDMARSRLMTPEETAQFLEIINSASGW